MRRIMLAIAGIGVLAMLVPTISIAGSHPAHHVKKGKRTVKRSRKSSHRKTTDTTSTTTSTGSGPPASVVSFDGTTLVLKVGGDDVSGTVTGRTRLRCPQPTTTTTTSTSTYTDPLVSTTTTTTTSDWQRGDPQGNGPPDGRGAGGPGWERDDEGGRHHSRCSSSSLTPGSAVYSADLGIGPKGAVWREVDLAG